MTNDVFKGQWKQIKGEVQKQWGKLTNDDLDKINGDRLKLEGAIQEKYGLEKKKVTERLEEIVKNCKC